MNDWFTIEHIDGDTHIISEYRHWEETHAYLLSGTQRSLLIDTGLGIQNIEPEVRALTDKPVTAVATHIHWDHIGGHKYFPDFCAHEAKLGWLAGEFPLSMAQIRDFVVERCDLPEGYRVEDYEFFQGTPTRVLRDGARIDLGGRTLEVLHTPGHSPGHMCFFEADRGYLFTGDLAYQDTLLCYYPSTDPEAYLASLERVAALPAKRVFPAHHAWDLRPALLDDTLHAFRGLKARGRLHHGAGLFSFDGFAVQL